MLIVRVSLALFPPADIGLAPAHQVDFATPKGYVEPERKAPAPIPTMANKLKIDINSTTSATSSRPSSVASVRPGSSVDAASGADEVFRGAGATLNGRRTKGKGKAKKVEEVDKDSKIIRTEWVPELC